MNTALDPLSDLSVDLAIAESRLKLAKIQARWNSYRSFYAPIIHAFMRLGTEPRMDDPDYISVTLSGNAQTLANAFRILRGSGFEFSGTRPKKGDTEWYAFFTHAECPVRVWFSFTSSVCRRVKTGTELKMVDVYETQCDDISTTADGLPAIPQADKAALLLDALS
jgi:hypothetical protein